MVWPNQDYFNLTWDRVKTAITDPAIRAGIFEIWLNHDYTNYAKATGDRTDFTLENWSPSDRMRLYIRKDVAAQVWSYGVGPAPSQVQADPYEKGVVTYDAIKTFGAAGDADGQFNAPRGLAVGPDGSVYVADSRHHRIQHFSADGQFLKAWGTFGDNSLQAAATGQFNEPWGVAVGPDGSVYVSDTWNHRIQKFTADGAPLLTWGHYGQAETPDAFWGPRGIDVDSQGKVYVADTGNKRIVVFDASGNFIAQFGQVGIEAGQFDEPTDIAVDSIGNVYVADTWNQRVQVFTPSPDGMTYSPTAQWDVAAWYGQSLDNKPYIAVDTLGHVFISDPEGFRVIEFTTQGKFIRLWGTYGTGTDAFALLSGIATDANGNVWVVDSGNNRIMEFSTPR
jgi:DNA-binding beta-propeller fold protein YncE